MLRDTFCPDNIALSTLETRSKTDVINQCDLCLSGFRSTIDQTMAVRLAHERYISSEKEADELPVVYTALDHYSMDISHRRPVVRLAFRSYESPYVLERCTFG